MAGFSTRLWLGKFTLLGLAQKLDLAPSPLAGEGWGEGVNVRAQTWACANFSTLSPALPRQGGGSEVRHSA